MAHVLLYTKSDIKRFTVYIYMDLYIQRKILIGSYFKFGDFIVAKDLKPQLDYTCRNIIIWKTHMTYYYLMYQKKFYYL